MTRRLAYFGAAPLLSLIVFRNIFRTWFRNDDFGWLQWDEVFHDNGLLYTLFHPLAQGTVRVFSERLPFLVFPAIFGLNPLPFRLLAFVTWLVALTLAALIGERLIGSRAAGLIAAMLWSVHAVLTQPLSWASDYNQVLCAACILTAFYARLRGWRAVEWIAYLIGFGALELIVVYPALATLHALCFDRKRLRSALPLFVPAAIFTVIHFFFIPNRGGPEYQIAIDRRLGSTLLEYVKWILGPTRLPEFNATSMAFAIFAAAVLGLSLLLFAIWRTWQRDALPLFCCGWFVITLAPVLILPNHVMDYAATIPAVGIAWLAAAGVLLGWRSGNIARIAATALAGFYFVLMVYETDLYTAWLMDRSLCMRALMDGVGRGHREHPEAVFLLQGVDDDVFQSGFEDDPFHLLGAKAYLTPGSEKNIVVRSSTLDLKPWIISQRSALDLLDGHAARVLNLSGTTVRDATPIYRTMLRLQMHEQLVDVSDPNSASQLGPGWYPPDKGIRWMQKSGVVKLAGPTASQKLIVNGYAPAVLVAEGPVQLRFTANGCAVGTATIKEPDAAFSLEFALPSALVGQPRVELTIEASRILHSSDPRGLAMAFTSFAIR